MFNGEHLSRGVDVLKLSPGDFVDVVWYWILKDMDAKESEKLGQKVWMPPRGEDVHPDDPFWGEEAEQRAADEMNKRRRG